MEAKHYTRCNTEGYIVYVYRKDFKIRAVHLDNKVDMNYYKSAQIDWDITHYDEFISNSYNRERE